jgi:hypothetical protein
MSCLSHPFDVIIDDVQAILGPRLDFAAHDSSFVEDSDSDRSYDDKNGLSIYEHKARVKGEGMKNCKSA